MDFLTKLCILGAAVLFAAWLVLKNRGRIACATDALAKVSRARLAAFLAFVAIATVCAQKPGGTNAPLRGASAELRVESVEVGVENGKWKVENGGVVAAGDSTTLHSTLYTLHSISTNDTYSFSMPSNGVCHSKWRRRGAADDWFALSPAGWSFALGDMSVTNLKVSSRGTARLPGGTEVSPLPAALGVVPEVNWGLLGSNAPSLFWHAVDADGSLLLTWQNVLLHRATTNPVSVQAAFRPSGGVTFRYDLSRLASDVPLSGVVPSAAGVTPDAPLSRNVTSVSFKSRDEAICDGFRTAFEESLGGLDPFSFPEGSTNTVLEHLFYSGTTNGAFAFPQTTEQTAVLRVAVTGTGSGDLLVGGSYVPLVGVVQRRGAGAQSNCLMLPAPKGGTVPVYLRGDGTLSVSFDSGDFAFGELPSIAANRSMGWINFPNTKATEPCVHDFGTRKRTVSLPVGNGADDLACDWSGAANVGVENIPPRSARITASFDARQTRTITYALSHPYRLFGQTEYSQTVRFCPRPPDPDPDNPDPEEEPSWYSEGDPTPDWDTEPNDEDAPEEPDGAGDGDEVCPVHEVPYEQCAHLHESDYTNAVQNVAHLGGVLYVRDPPVVDEQIYLEVPNEHVNCCGCPDHWTNCVSVAYRSPCVRVTGPGGQDFSSTGESCTVDVAGVRPSRAVGDAGLAFARNGEIYERRDYTALGVAIRKGGVPLSRYNELNQQFGYPMTVCTNDWRAPELELVTNVRLPSGTVHLEFAGATAPFALWYLRRGESEYRKLLDSETCPVKVIPIAAWHRVVAGVAAGRAASVPVLVTSSAPGTVRLVLRYWTADGGAFVEDSAEQRITSLNPTLLSDADGDWSLGEGDVAAQLAGRTFRFWTNEDIHKGDYVGQSLDLSPNASDLVVNGRLDLVNLFPVKLDLKPFVDAWGQGVTFILWSPASGSLRFCGLDVQPDSAWAYQTNDVYTTTGDPVCAADLIPVSGDGVGIAPSDYLGNNNSPGLLAFEAASGVSRSDALFLLVMDGDDVLFSYSLPLAISSVRSMYRWLNIRNAAGGAGGEASSLGEPWNRPDAECDGRHFVFVHGYNVNPAAARQWADAMFKRLWLGGSKSMFTAVDWHGDDSQFSTLAHGDVSPDYYANVMHAFASAPAFASHVAALPGTSKVVLAHSLGNMLASSAAVDHNLQYSRYYMLNAAVPMEAYDTDMFTSNMVDSAWSNVPVQYRASDWSSLFATNDFRSSLSWCGRFAGIQNAVNCYSETEDVLANPTQHGLGGAWSKQELFKGTMVWHGLNAVPYLGLDVACEGGWGINAAYAVDPYYYVPAYGFFANAMTNFTREDAIESPLFTPFKIHVAAMHSTNLFEVADAAYRDSLRAKFLGDAIPATSFAAGANAIDGQLDNYNMQNHTPNDWPEELMAEVDDGTKVKVWKHSDIKNVAYYYVYLLFNKLLE